MNAPHRKTLQRLGLGALLLCQAGATLAYEPAQGSFNFNRALYQHFSQDHLSAVVTALDTQSNAQSRANATPTQMDAKTLAFVTDNLLSYGLYREALRRFRGATAEQALDNETRATLWLRLARYAYERGYLNEAETSLTEMRVDVGGRRNRTERALLLAQIQLQQNKPAEAVETLLDGRVYAKNDFARYNLAMAFIATGDVRRGRRELDKLGREVVNDPVEHALRDRANLALAYNFLAEAKGASAKPVLRRIRVEGPYSDEALLGLGWAEIAGDKADEIRLTKDSTDNTIGGVLGALLRPGKVDENLRARLGMIGGDSGIAEESQDARFRQALIPWLQLDGRDPKKPAVLEVQLAIPYALDALGEKERALGFYQRAVDRLEAGRTGLDKAIDGIQSGRMIETMIRRDRDREAGWNWRLRDLPDAPETYYLAEILGENTFQEALKNYRDLKQVQRKLARQRTLLSDSSSGANKATVPPQTLFARKLKNSAPLWSGVQPKLRLETQLGRFPRNETLEGLLAWTYRYAPKIQLQLDRQHGLLARGPDADVSALIARIDAVLESSNNIIGAQRALLEKIAVSALEQHKAMLTRYLIDARFALARLFDEAQQGDALK